MKIGVLAKKTGLTIRALHHYDEIGLVKASGRNASGHRVYNAQDILKLQKALALQQLGLPLAEIIVCLAANTLTFHELARKQMHLLEEKIAVQKQLYRRLDAMCTLFADQDAIPVDEVIKTIEVSTMYDKYYNPVELEKFATMLEKYFKPEQLDQLTTYHATITPEISKDTVQRWECVFQGIRKALAAGKKASDPQVIALGKEANALIDIFTGMDPEIEKSLRNMYDAEGGSNVLKHHGMNIIQNEFDFLNEAMVKARK